jgi:hypothetical protein
MDDNNGTTIPAFSDFISNKKTIKIALDGFNMLKT